MKNETLVSAHPVEPAMQAQILDCLGRLEADHDVKVLFACVTTGKSVHALKSGMSKFPQIMKNVRTAQKVNLDTLPAVQSAVQSVEEKLAGRGRVLLRPSGTEPVVRVMVEGEDDTLVRALCDELAHVVQRAVG